MTTKAKKPPLLLPDAFVVIPDERVYGPYPYDGLQIFGYVIIAIFPVLSLVVCGLRVHSRRLAKGFGMGKSRGQPVRLAPLADNAV